MTVLDRLRDFALRFWLPAVVAGLLLVLSNGPVMRFATGVLNRPGTWNDWAVWPIFAGVAAVSAVLAWVTWRRGIGVGVAGPDWAMGSGTERVLLSRPALVATAWYCAVAAASSLWSVYAGATLWRAAVYSGLALLAVVIARLGDDELSTAIVLLAGVAVAGSLVVIVLSHEVGTDHLGNWIGLYTNRNSLAPLAALGVITGVRCLLPSTSGWAVEWRRVSGAALVAASLVTLVGAGSRTAWFSLAAAVAVASTLGAVAGLSRSRGWRPPQVRAVAAAAALVAAGAGAAVVAAVWDVSTFAQRRTIWSLSWDRIVERPWGGHGFFAFWEVPELVQGHELLQRGSAHNSLVETALGLGALGTAPFVILAVLAAANAGRGLWLRPSADTWMWAAVTVFVLFENAAESFVLWFSYIWVLLLAAALRRGETLHAANQTADAQPS